MSGSSSLRRVIVNTTKAPKALGPYNQAILVDKTMYLSGSLGMDPKTMELVAGGATAEARQALINIGEILNAAGATYNNVVKATVLLKDIKDFAAVNEVYAEYFKSPNEPARACYQVAALPKGASVEIETVAVIGDIVDDKSKIVMSMRHVVRSSHAPSAVGPYNQGVQLDRVLYLSGQLGLDPRTNVMVAGGVEEQARQALINLQQVLKAVKGTMKDVVKTTILLKDINDLARVGKIYLQFFPESSNCQPARTSYQAAELPRGGLVMIEAVAVVGARTAGEVWQY